MRRPSEVVRVSPDMAKSWLDESKQVVDWQRVQRYADDMRSGRWDAARHRYRPLTFDPTGRLCNGHHRLAAVVACGLSVDMFVETRGVP